MQIYMVIYNCALVGFSFNEGHHFSSTNPIIFIYDMPDFFLEIAIQRFAIFLGGHYMLS